MSKFIFYMQIFAEKLKERSEYFRSMLTYNMLEQQNKCIKYVHVFLLHSVFFWRGGGMSLW